MAIDTREKRASVPGVGRPWYRTKLPGTVDAAWRSATGLTYAGVSFSAPVIPDTRPRVIKPIVVNSLISRF